jgi:putative transposase
VLAHDGSVVKLAPLLAKLFPATRTNAVKAAAKLHATTDLVHRRLVKVVLTGERDGELAVARAEPIEPNTLHINDLGYFAYDYFAAIKKAKAHFLSRLKDNANPVVVRVRHGVFAPVRSIGMRFADVLFCQTQDTFDLDATFQVGGELVELRVVGRFNQATQKYHCYVTTLPPERFDVLELANLYSLRWVIELVFKLLKSSCHLDHVNTSNPDALRTHIYASLLASVLLTAVTAAAAQAAEIHPSRISPLVVAIAAPLLALPLALLWLGRNVTADELADVILRTVATGCIDQNPGRTRLKWSALS